jgi:uncharacterized protein YigA (DUF484 family)
MNAADRVEKFLDTRQEMLGLDPELIGSVASNASDFEPVELVPADLRILVRKARRLETVLPLIDGLAAAVRIEGRPQ